MIKKRGNKTNRTVMMENEITEYFDREYSVDMLPEQSTHTGRADLLGYLFDNNGNLQDVIIVEIKQAVQDFYSGHGLNFLGVSNYLAVPSELVGYAIVFLRDKLNRTDVGVLEVCESGNVRTVIYPQKNYRNAYISEHRTCIMLTNYHLLKSRRDII